MVIWTYFIAVLSLNWLYENRNPDKYYPENILDLALLTYMFMSMMNRHIANPIIEFGCNEIRYNLNEQRMKFFKWAIIVLIERSQSLFGPQTLKFLWGTFLSMGGLILGHGTDSSGTCFVFRLDKTLRFSRLSWILMYFLVFGTMSLSYLSHGGTIFLSALYQSYMDIWYF